MPIAIEQKPFNDFEVLRHALQDAPMDIIQTERGVMRGSLSHLSVGSVGISTGSYSRGIVARGLGSKHRLVFPTHLDAVTINHISIKPGQQIIMQPDAEFYFNTEHANQYVTAFADTDEILDFVETLQPGAADSPLWREAVAVQALDPKIAAARVRAYETLMTSLAEHGPTMSDDTADYHKRSLLQLVTAPIIGSVRYHGAHIASKERLIKEILQFFSTLTRPVTISELCQRFRVQERSLHRAFHEVLGISPGSFMRIKRLNDAHTAFLRDGHITVRAIAAAHGFFDFGRFATAYRHMFSEYPSQTLKRSAHGILTALFVFFIGACMHYDYEDCDHDDYFVTPSQRTRILLPSFEKV